MFDFKLINTLYLKNKLPETTTAEELVIILYYLAQDKKLQDIVSNILNYLFIVNPLHLYYNLYYTIPQGKVPYFKKIEKITETTDIVTEELIKLMKWNKREVELTKPFIDKLLDKEKLKMELGL